MGDTITGALQYLRKGSLIVGTDGGDALDLSELHFTFSVRQFELQTPNVAEIRVYNLAQTTMQRVKKEFTRVVLQAGYPDNFGVIFSGTVKQVRIGRTGPDNYLDIGAADGDLAYNFAIISVTLAAGSTALDVINACVTTMTPLGVKLGPLPPNLPETRMPRARVLYGMTREILRQVANLIGCSWSIQNGVLTFIPQAGALEGDVVELTSSTGLIGLPEQTQDGIIVRCLINPRIFVGRRIRINNTQVNQARFNLSYTGVVANALLPSVAADGYYRVLSIDYMGDMRGQDWYCVLSCIGLDATVPLSQAAKGRVIETTGGTAP